MAQRDSVTTCAEDGCLGAQLSFVRHICALWPCGCLRSSQSDNLALTDAPSVYAVGYEGAAGLEINDCQTLVLPRPLLKGNVVGEACRGCALIHGSDSRLLGMGEATAQLPENNSRLPLAWDASTQVFSIHNAHSYACFGFLTFTGADILDRDGCKFSTGLVRHEDGNIDHASTFVLVLEPNTYIELGRVPGRCFPRNHFFIGLRRLCEHPCGSLATIAQTFQVAAFPLPAENGPYFCTQGIGGHLTHFFPESFHAIDFRCECGTPVLSIGDGVVTDVRTSHCCSGIHVAHLGMWNSLAVRLDTGFVVEYLHVLPDSTLVQCGDRVVKGQVLCHTGDVGFSPEPHLHIEMHQGDELDGPSVLLLFNHKAPFLPRAGCWYSPCGEVKDKLEITGNAAKEDLRSLE